MMGDIPRTGDFKAMALDLKDIKRRLEAKRAELLESINALSEAHPQPVGAIEAGEGPNDPADIAVDALEIEQEQSLLVNQQALLTEVERAIERIEKGTYGKCTNCGRPIPEKRLEAIPWASHDVKCEEQLEQRNLAVTATYDADLN
jgi:DnaK suppressor protein